MQKILVGKFFSRISIKKTYVTSSCCKDYHPSKFARYLSVKFFTSGLEYFSGFLVQNRILVSFDTPARLIYSSHLKR